MELGSYWWLLIWMFLAGGLGYFFIIERDEIVQGFPERRWKWLPAGILALPYVIWAGWRTDSFGDTGMYRGTFKRMPTGLSNLPSYLETRPKGKGFVVFEYLFKTLVTHSTILFFLFVAAIQLYFIVRIYRKYSRNYWFSLFLFIASTDYLSWMHNGIRQFLAATLIFTCIPLIAKKKYLLMCLVILLAALIHSSALLVLPFVFVVNGRAWNVRTLLFILLVGIAIYYVDSISDVLVDMMRDTAYEGDIDIYLSDDGTNLLRVLFYAIPTFMALFFRPYIDRSRDSMISICVNLSIISTGIYIFSFFTSGILIGAIPIYFSLGNYILIPWLIEEVFHDSSKRVLYFFFVIVYCVFFYYQCGPTWGLL